MLTERSNLVAILTRDWCCSMAPPGPVWHYNPGTCSRLPKRGSAQSPKKLSLGAKPHGPLSAGTKMSCMAWSSVTQLWCMQLFPCFHPRDELVSGQLFHSLVHYIFPSARSRIGEATSLDTLNALSGRLYWLYSVFATHLVSAIHLRFRLSSIRLEG